MALGRGDICLVDFNPAKGGEIGKLRPAILMSKADEIEVLDTVIVIPLSTVIQKDTKPYRVHITKREKLLYDSDACIYEIRALSKIRVGNKIACVGEKEFEEISRCLCELLS